MKEKIYNQLKGAGCGIIGLLSVQHFMDLDITYQLVCWTLLTLGLIVYQVYSRNSQFVDSGKFKGEDK